MFNTPVISEGNLFGLSGRNSVFCVKMENGKRSWDNPLAAGNAQAQANNQDKQDDSGRGRRGRRGRGGGRGGYGSIVSVGSVLIGLSPSAELVVFERSGSQFKEIARYKVSDTQTYAYPVPVGNRIYIKDKNSVSMWTLE